MKKLIQSIFLLLLILFHNSCSIFQKDSQTEQELKEHISSQKNSVEINVDATIPGKTLKHIWSYYGYDEANFTTEPDCISLMKTVAEINF